MRSILALLVSLQVNTLAMSLPSHSLKATSSHALEKRSSLDRIVVVGGNIGKDDPYYCSDSQVSQIDNDLAWMRKLAVSAYNFLLEDDSQTTAAYIAWFGGNIALFYLYFLGVFINISPNLASNANRDTANSIRRNVYDSISDLGDETKAYVGNLDAGSNAVVLGCPSLHTEPECDDVRAMTQPRRGAVMLCPSFFEERSNYEEEFRRWRDLRTRSLTNAETLLHEMTHIPGVVGSSWETDDIAYTADQ